MKSQPALPAEVHGARRKELARYVEGAVLLVGNGLLARNLPLAHLPFRQDSNFLYLTGCNVPGAAAILVDGKCELFLELPGPEDALWHGASPNAEMLRVSFGVDAVRDARELEGACARFGSLRTLAVADPNQSALAARLSGASLGFGSEHGDGAVVDALIQMRGIKKAEEVTEHRLAAKGTEAAHRTAMAATRPGGHEREIAALFDGVLAAMGCVPGYDSIVTVRGEVLHNPHHENPLADGDLLLLDGGAERESGYGTDVTRTWPVSGRFDARARGAYQAVLASQTAAIALCRAGTRYREVHLESARVLARWLCDEGLVTCGVEEAVETGAHALFYPHGVGHFLGLDVHDLEQFGDRAAYAEGRERSDTFGLSYLRLDMDLKPGHLVTVEPGFYVVPAILQDARMRQHHRGRVNFERAESWQGFGGIRIEDDVLVTKGGPEVLTGSIPKTVKDLEALVGSGKTPYERFFGERRSV